LNPNFCQLVTPPNPPIWLFLSYFKPVSAT
jgi:hypothetical protein